MAFRKLALPALASAMLAVTGLAISTTSASAYVVCNGEGDCWHTESRYQYPGAGFTTHPDDWYFHQTWDANHHWRDYNKGRGYWRGGAWVRF
jgi:hypothetical protein